MKTVLVTGAGGFLGRYITEKLVASGCKVRALNRKRYASLDALGVKTFQGDIQDEQTVYNACQDVEEVYHVASISGIGEPWDRYYRVNTQGTQNVIRACEMNGVRKLIYTSSPSVTFTGEDQKNVDESAPYPKKWLAHYPHSKALAESAVLSANKENGLLTCALRPHLIWGPRDEALIPRLLSRARSGRLRRVGSGNNLVDMIYVENAAAAHLQASAALNPGSSVCGRAYFLSQGEPVLCWEWINEILSLADIPPIQKSISLRTAVNLGWICERVWKVFQIERDPPMSRFLAYQLARDHYFNISRARNDFHYSPEISTEEGMRRLGEFLKGISVE